MTRHGTEPSSSHDKWTRRTAAASTVVMLGVAGCSAGNGEAPKQTTTLSVDANAETSSGNAIEYYENTDPEELTDIDETIALDAERREKLETYLVDPERTDRLDDVMTASGKKILELVENGEKGQFAKEVTEPILGIDDFRGPSYVTYTHDAADAGSRDRISVSVMTQSPDNPTSGDIVAVYVGIANEDNNDVGETFAIRNIGWTDPESLKLPEYSTGHEANEVITNGVDGRYKTTNDLDDVETTVVDAQLADAYTVKRLNEYFDLGN